MFELPWPGRGDAPITGRGVSKRVVTYGWRSWYFHPAEFEYDAATGTAAVTQINTCDHPHRPASLPCETLTIKKTYQRAGFDVSVSGGSGAVPLAGAGANAKWSDMEMHDAMQTYWSRFASKAHWAMWVFFASLHEQGTSLGGIMFDDIGPNHRQGTAMFNDSFIKNAPAGDASPAAWVSRMKFWTACHEMGHAFNLAHSWQKSLGAPWITLANEPEARSFMNYPYNVSGGQSAFFSDFEFRFSDGELLFMRHAPERFVQMGNADWFDHHGFEQTEVSPEPKFTLELRTHRTIDYHEFLEPVSVELKLVNTSGSPQIVDSSVLAPSDDMTVVVKKSDKAARAWAPYARHCHEPDAVVLEAGRARYGSINVSSGLNGCDIAEPGYYFIQVALRIAGEDVVSNRLPIRVAPPKGWDEEFIAQDFFTEHVARTLAFNGTEFLSKANDTLQEIADRLADRRVARHAEVALADRLTRDYKLIDIPDTAEPVTSVAAAKGRIRRRAQKTTEARKYLDQVLIKSAAETVDTLGHIPFHNQVDEYSSFLGSDDPDAAAKSQSEMHKVFRARGVLDSVLKEIDKNRAGFARRKPTRGAAKKKR